MTGGAGLRLPPEIPTPGNLRMHRTVALLDEVVYGIIRRTRAESSGDERTTLLRILHACRDELSGRGMSDRELRDEVMTLFLAGHDTTALTLTWCLYMLARRPKVQDELHDEIVSAVGDRVPTMDDVDRLPLLRSVIAETLRLRGPVWAIARNAVGDDELLGHRIKAGDIVVPSPYLLSRHPDYWDAPSEFRPRRFVDAKPTHEFAYLPFSRGPRMCVGAQFANVEAAIVLATLLREFRLRPADARPVHPRAQVTLRPDGPVPVVFRWRESPRRTLHR